MTAKRESTLITSSPVFSFFRFLTSRSHRSQSESDVVKKIEPGFSSFVVFSRSFRANLSITRQNHQKNGRTPKNTQKPSLTMAFSLSRCPPKQQQRKRAKKHDGGAVSSTKTDVKPDISSVLEDLDSNTIVPPKRRKRRRHHDTPIPSFALTRNTKRNEIFDLSVLLDSPPEKVVAKRRVDQTIQSEIEGGEEKKPPTDVAMSERTSAALPASAFDSDGDSDLENIPSGPVFRKLDSKLKVNVEGQKGEQSVRATIEREDRAEAEIDSKLSTALPQEAAVEASSSNIKDISEPLDQPEDVKIPAVVAATPNAASTSSVASTPFREKLFASLDFLYLQADINSVTVKDIIDALEVEFEMRMDKKTRKSIKSRLTSIISGKVIPMAGSQSDSGGTPASTAKSETPALAAGTRTEATIPTAATAITTTNPAKEVASTVPATMVGQPAENFTKQILVQKAHPPPKSEPEAPVLPLPEKPPVKRRARAPRKKQTDGGAPAVTKKPPRKRARKGNCSLCTTCPCGNANDSTSPSHTFGEHISAAGRTEIEVEKNLIKRQKKLEKTVDKYESDLDLVSRELKRHRRTILKRKGTQLLQGREQAFGDSRFLPDAWEVHTEQVQHNPGREVADVAQVQRNIFGKVKGGQPTLTQMMGGGDGGDDKEREPLAAITEEPEVAPSQDSDAYYLQDDDEHSLETEQEAPADNFQRVSWRDGKQGESDSRPLWSAMSSGKASAAERSSGNETSTWDRMFSKRMNSPSVGGGFDELLGLFGSDAPGLSLLSQPSTVHAIDEEDDEDAQINTSQLSQPAQDLADSIEAKVIADPVKLARIEEACPNWRENIRFALLQRGEGDIHAALINIQDSKAKLNKMKEEFLAAWGRQQTVMCLFEMSLSASMQRVAGTEGAQDEGAPAGTTEGADSAILDISSEIESDAETVTEFSPLSQEEPDSAMKTLPERNICSAKKPDYVKSRAFVDETSEHTQKDEVTPTV
jgi:hypothetical protein